jgi:hypothetical protein
MKGCPGTGTGPFRLQYRLASVGEENGTLKEHDLAVELIFIKKA